ncbi:MAG: Hpt domain-containing protein [Proteobacteria bacterium]|nr:MAG: Hpt domain-containing protein [Pseudomonadota bacterium]
MLDAEITAQLVELEQDDNEGLVEKLVSILREKAPQIFAEIERGIAAGEAERIKAAVHSFRSSCSNLGASVSAAICEEMESHANKNNLSAVPALYQRLMEAYPLDEQDLIALAASVAKK